MVSMMSLAFFNDIIDDVADETFTSSLCTMMLPVYSSWTFHSQDLISNSPYCLPSDSYDVNWENKVLDQRMIP